VRDNSQRSINVVIGSDITDPAILRGALKRLRTEHAAGSRTLMQLHVTLDETLGSVFRFAWLAGGAHALCARMSALRRNIRRN
jgi:hypothetical protein